MKSVFLGFGLTLCVILSVIIILTLNGRSIRSNELNDALNSSLEETVRILKDNNTYTINNADEFVADFIQSLLLQINSDSTITVNVLGLDYEKGLLSVEVVETYSHPDGSVGKVSAVRTVIMENYTVVNKEDICYNLTYKIGDETYKTYTLKQGAAAIIPADAIEEGAQFEFWTYEDGSRADLSRITLTENVVLYAKFSR